MRPIVRYSLLPLALMLLVAACQDRPSPFEPGGISALVSDGAHGGGNPDFFFLPPLVGDPSSSPYFDPGAFNGRLQPVMAVFKGSDPCSLSNVKKKVYGPVVVPVVLTEEMYHIDWNTDKLKAGTLYRLCIFGSAAGKWLGFVDVTPVTSGLKNVQTGEVVKFQQGRVVPVKFRIEQGALSYDPAHPDAIGTEFTVGPAGGSVTLANTAGDLLLAAVSVPANAVPQGQTVTIILATEDPQYTGKCLPGALVQSNWCYQIRTEPNLYQFGQLLRVEICVDPEPVPATQRDLLRVHKYNTTQGLQALPWADPTLIGPDCAGSGLGLHATPQRAADGVLLRFARWTGRLLVPRDVHAAELLVSTPPKGIGGMSGSFSDFGGAVQTAAKLAFTVQPTATWVGDIISPAVQVAIQDELGNTVTTATDVVTINGLVEGDTSVAAVSGVATFSNLRVNYPGTLTLHAYGVSGVTDATSDAFTVNAFTAISAGYYHTCGLTTSGEVYCWGLNTSGQLGNRSTTNSSTPMAVSGAHTFVQVGGGLSHTCGVTFEGAAYCWGENSHGELGDGSTTNSTTPVLVSGGHTFGYAVTAGEYFTCGTVMDVDYAVYCWGYNVFGQLGNGSNNNASTPVQVASDGLVLVIDGFPNQTFSMAGHGHSCAMNILNYRAAYCWGYNEFGQLGNGSNSSSSTPVQVSGGFAIDFLAGGYEHTCGLTQAGAAYCWGLNSGGQLGNGSFTNSNVPVPVVASGGLVFASMSAGGYHTCGVAGPSPHDQNYTVYCWGENSYGELGDSSTTSRAVPVRVSGGLIIRSVSAGKYHTCALAGDGRPYCWGRNDYGQLGNGSTTNSATPVRVSIP